MLRIPISFCANGLQNNLEFYDDGTDVGDCAGRSLGVNDDVPAQWPVRLDLANPFPDAPFQKVSFDGLSEASADGDAKSTLSKLVRTIVNL